MKKIFTLITLVMLFMACSSDDQQEPAVINHPIKKSELIGVWADGDYFVSFDSEGFYSVYIADNFIDCGDYSIQVPTSNNGEIKADIFFDGHLLGIIGHSHFSTLDKHINFAVDELTQTSMKIIAFYTILQPYNNESKVLYLTKTDKVPANKNHSFIDCSYSELCTIDGKETTSTISLETYNTGLQTTDHEEASKFPIKLHYVYCDNTIFYQKKIPNRQLESLPIWYGWNDDDTGKVYSHTFIER